ncbi:MAG: hypothetical protein IT181_21720 [Acidobacteria bacterium]|nr:hypothetical protein [Acidobacteriota bacterium]
MKLEYEEFDLSAVRRYPLASRSSKVRREDLATPHQPGQGISAWLSRLPNLLAARDLVAVVDAVAAAPLRPAPVIWGLGAHVIKAGLSPVLVDLMARGYVSALALNGAGIIHDVEMALAGATSEDVDAALGPGAFGMAEETGTGINRAIVDGVARGWGLGRSVAEWLAAAAPPHADVSLLCAAVRHGVPVTVHVAMGTDIIHMHPNASGASIGEGRLRDFRHFTSSVARLAGGVYLNCGSAVVLPEVFLKAVAVARNHGHDLTGLTTVDLDFLPHYRPLTNVVRRPTAGIGRGIHLTGHHEILIPLLAAALVERSGTAGA